MKLFNYAALVAVVVATAKHGNCYLIDVFGCKWLREFLIKRCVGSHGDGKVVYAGGAETDRVLDMINVESEQKKPWVWHEVCAVLIFALKR